MTETPKKSSSIFDSFIFAVIVALSIRIFLFEPFAIPSGSMKPNLEEGDYIFICKYCYGISKHSIPFAPNIFSGRVLEYSKPKRGDVIVFKLPSDTSIYYIKRLIGLPGDKIKVSDGIVFINGKALKQEFRGNYLRGNDQAEIYRETNPENYSYNTLERTTFNDLDNTPEFIVPEGNYFFMGDNRDQSIDSRASVGYVPAENLVGKAEIIVFSNTSPIYLPWEWILNFDISRFFKFIE